jgi:hypothetical protein
LGTSDKKDLRLRRIDVPLKRGSGRKRGLNGTRYLRCGRKSGCGSDNGQKHYTTQGREFLFQAKNSCKKRWKIFAFSSWRAGHQNWSWRLNFSFPNWPKLNVRFITSHGVHQIGQLVWCKLRKMPTREHPPSWHTGLPGDGDSRWDAIWQLVLQAGHLPAEKRSAFLQSVETDPFIIRQALAIVEGSESVATSADSLPLAPEERFAPQPGHKIGKYRVGTLLGSGGAGSVYAAFDEELNRPVAIKFVSSRRKGNAETPASHLREARAASALNHPTSS